MLDHSEGWLCLLRRTKQDIVLSTTLVLAFAKIENEHMHRGQTKGEKGLSKPVRTRLTKTKYNELELLARESKGETISSIARKIIQEQPIKIFRHDESLDLVMEELAANRAEIRSIGVNINQMVKLFNSYPDLKPKMFYAKNGYESYLRLENNIETLLTKVEQLAIKWLSEWKTEKTSECNML